MQQKYGLTQNDVEQFQEPYMKRTVKNDIDKDAKNAELGLDVVPSPLGNQTPNPSSVQIPKAGVKESFKESVDVAKALKFIEDDSAFIKEIKKKFSNNILFTDKDVVMEVLKKEVVGGSNIIRLVRTNGGREDSTNFYSIFNNLEMTNSVTNNLEIANKYFDLLIENVKLQYDDYYAMNTKEDELSDELFKAAKTIQWEITKGILDHLKSTAIKEGLWDKKKILKEGQINPDALNNMDNLFAMFNDRMKGKVDEIVDKLAKANIEIIDDMDGNEEPTEETDSVKDNKDMIKNMIMDQFKLFNQTQSQDLKRILTNGIIAGTPVNEIQQNLKDEVIDWKKTKPSDNDYQIARIANTETHKAGIQLKLLQWKDMGVAHVKYLAMDDEKVRPEHRKLNNQIFSIDDAMGLDEWKDINCRCIFIPVRM